MLIPARRPPGKEHYWTNYNVSGLGNVSHVNRNGGTPSIAVDRQLEPYGIASDGSFIYWTAFAGNLVGRALLDGGAGPDGGRIELLATGEPSPRGVAVDGTAVYWVNQGNIRMLPLDGGRAVTLAAQQPAPELITVDSKAIYWTNSLVDGGTVMKLAKP